MRYRILLVLAAYVLGGCSAPDAPAPRPADPPDVPAAPAVVQEAAADRPAVCQDASSTVAINQCLSLELERVEANLSRYLDAGRMNLAGDQETLGALNSSQATWETYRSQHCDAVYSRWRDGSIRGAMLLQCRIDLARLRTREIWRAFLVDAAGDSPGGLEEPGGSDPTPGQH